MPNRRNLVHEKLVKAKPDDRIHFQVGIRAGLLKGKVTTYGQTADYIRAALESYNKTKYHDGLVLLIAEVSKTIEQLELWRDDKESSDDWKIDRGHLKLLEGWKDIYFRLLNMQKLLKRKRSK